VIKTAAALPHRIVASLLWLVITATLPWMTGLDVTVFGGSLLVLLALGVAERPVVRILRTSGRPTPDEARGPVVICGWPPTGSTSAAHPAACCRPPPSVDAVGRRQIPMTREVVDAYRARRMAGRAVAALIVQGIGRLRWGRTPLDLAGLSSTAL